MKHPRPGPLVVINVYGWWESQHYTASVIAVCDTEEDAIAAMLADVLDHDRSEFLRGVDVDAQFRERRGEARPAAGG